MLACKWCAALCAWQIHRRFAKWRQTQPSGPPEMTVCVCVTPYSEGSLKIQYNTFFFFFLSVLIYCMTFPYSRGNNGSLTGLISMKIMPLICYGLHSHQTKSASALQHLHQTLIREYRIKLILSVEHHSFREPIPRNSPSFALFFFH